MVFIDKDLQLCKEYDTSDEIYSDFFLIDSLKQALNIADVEDSILNLRLYVVTSASGRILLSSKDQMDANYSAFEIGEAVSF